MKNNFLKSVKNIGLAITACTIFLTSCNKGFEEIPSTAVTPVSNQNMAQKLNADPNYSIFVTALQKYGLFNRLANEGNFTVLALDNPTMTFVLSNFSLTPASFAALPAGQPAALAPVFQYHVVPQNVPAANIASAFTSATTIYPAQIPNTQLPSSLNIGTTSGLPIMMNIFLGKNGGNSFANTTPISQPDAIVASNGVLHKVAAPVMPPSQTLGQLIAADANLTLFAAAIARADSGQAVGTTNQLGFVMNFPVANVSVFAPTNNALKGLINVLSGGLVPLAAPDATFISFINNNIPVTSARGIVVYHLLGNRTYSVNLPLATQTVRTLLNAAVPVHPGFTVERSTAAPRLLGLANGAGNFSNFIATDRNAINGVLHVIDRVLLPQ